MNKYKSKIKLKKKERNKKLAVNRAQRVETLPSVRVPGLHPAAAETKCGGRPGCEEKLLPPGDSRKSLGGGKDTWRREDTAQRLKEGQAGMPTHGCHPAAGRTHTWVSVWTA